MVGRLFRAVPRGCLQFVIVVFPDHTHLLFLHIVQVCVSTLWDVGLTSNQAVMGSLFLSSTILLLKWVMNNFLQSFPFLLIERRTVINYWPNPTPGPFVSIIWEHLGIISLPLLPITGQ